MAFLIAHVADSVIRRRQERTRPLFRSLPPCNKTKDDQDKTKRRLLSEIYIATDYEYLSGYN